MHVIISFQIFHSVPQICMLISAPMSHGLDSCCSIINYEIVNPQKKKKNPSASQTTQLWGLAEGGPNLSCPLSLPVTLRVPIAQMPECGRWQISPQILPFPEPTRPDTGLSQMNLLQSNLSICHQETKMTSKEKQARLLTIRISK